ncbi:bestrophin protein [Rhizoctonia solani AG-3 Rhs1AP]|uniref:Bestrophin protein n=1 Tax=Rhizoctonia solani AG-3 Rhs1AP TaxID=1086054 RepID=A0A0A1UIC3_9AGAM|nr:bestrophin protein [Rhizoctonia solani AG-3 Rhs1AP]
MVSANPLIAGGFTLRKFRGTVLNDVWPEIIFFTCIAVMVTCVEKYTTTQLTFSNQLLTVLGTVIGLVLSFRTTSAYDRYWEGRKLWSTISLSSRNLATVIWIHVPTDRTPKDKDKDQDSVSEPLPKDHLLRAKIEKASMINLVQAFSVAVKHYLRGEPGIYYKDLYPLIAFLPQYAIEDAPSESDDKLPLWSDDANLGGHHLPRDPNSTEGGFKPKKGKTFDPEKVLPDVAPDHVHLAPARNPPQTTFFDYFPFLMPIKTLFKLIKRIFVRQANDGSLQDGERGAWTGKKKHRPVVESIVPLEISLHLNSYFDFLLQSGLLQSSAAGAFGTNLNSLQDAAVQLRRIATTPLPFAYQAHLRMAIWLYVFFLPFQIYEAMKWLTIPATTLTALLFIGFLEIGAEVENPFNYDDNDLDIDGYCLAIARELAEIMAHEPKKPTSFIFNKLNQPFAPGDRRTASDLLSSKEGNEYLDETNGMESVHATMVRNWRSVTEMTTHHKQKIAA